jgi:hypothetical protein
MMAILGYVIADYLSWLVTFDRGDAQKNGLLCRECVQPLFFFRVLGRPDLCELCHERELNNINDLSA